MTEITLTVLVLAIPTLRPTNAGAQADHAVEIAVPSDGAILSGVVEIRGTVDGANFLAANLAFRYDAGQDEQWFSITDVTQPANNSQLAVWDTTVITDGAYFLRLRMTGNDGTVQDDVVRVEVRNYTAAPTPTASATPTLPPSVKIPTPAIVISTPITVQNPVVTPTSLPPNPARLTETELIGGLVRGAGAVVAVALLWGAVILRRRL
ncbi:MAG TPA: hypothetical protein VFH29_10025 [Anaerolineales bacterium]|nr:hypothetical protein [Anaerolineales bacterium]